MHFSHIGLTDARTFIAPVSSRIQDPRTSHESDGRVKHGPLGRPRKIAGDGSWPQLGPGRPFMAGCAACRGAQTRIPSTRSTPSSKLLSSPCRTRRSKPPRPTPTRRACRQIQVTPPQSRLLEILDPRRSARSGSSSSARSRGYSTIAMARCLPEDGLLTTLEFDPAHAEVAWTNIERAGRRRPGRPARRRRARDPPPPRLRRLRPLRLRLHRRRQGQHPGLLRLGPRPHPPRRPDLRRQRRPRRRHRRPRRQTPTPSAQRTFHEYLAEEPRGHRDDDPDRRRQGLRRLHPRRRRGLEPGN